MSELVYFEKNVLVDLDTKRIARTAFSIDCPHWFGYKKQCGSQRNMGRFQHQKQSEIQIQIVGRRLRVPEMQSEGKHTKITDYNLLQNDFYAKF